MAEQPEVVIRGQRARAFGRTNGVIGEGPYVSYPLNLGETDEEPWMMFTPMRMFKINTTSPENTESYEAIALPMPSNLTDTLNLTYADFSGGFFEGLLETIGNGGDGGWERLKELAGRAGMTLLKDNARLLSRDNGLAYNPRHSVAFQFPQLKVHNFIWNMVATSEAESRRIEAILRKFRYHSLPGFADGNNHSAYEYPEVWDIEFFDHYYLYKPNWAVLTTVAVTYNGQSSPVFFDDTNAPVEVTLALEFKEIIAENKEIMLEKIGEIGGGLGDGV